VIHQITSNAMTPPSINFITFKESQLSCFKIQMTKLENSSHENEQHYNAHQKSVELLFGK
jgi:hypothetical protein